MLFPIRIPPTHMAFPHFKIKVVGGKQRLSRLYLSILVIKGYYSVRTKEDTPRSIYYGIGKLQVTNDKWALRSI